MSALILQWFTVNHKSTVIIHCMFNRYGYSFTVTVRVELGHSELVLEFRVLELECRNSNRSEISGSFIKCLFCFNCDELTGSVHCNHHSSSCSLLPRSARYQRSENNTCNISL